MHKHLRRLERVWIESPIYFVTTCTRDRRAVLARDDVAKILIEEWSAAQDRHGWAIGRYVIMPNHVHFFCRPVYDAKTLPEFVGAWKNWTSRKISQLSRPRSATAATTPLWQREFLITFFVPARAIRKSGTTSSTIRCARAWFLRQATGNM